MFLHLKQYYIYICYVVPQRDMAEKGGDAMETNQATPIKTAGMPLSDFAMQLEDYTPTVRRFTCCLVYYV